MLLLSTDAAKVGGSFNIFSSLSVYLPLLCVPAGQIHFPELLAGSLWGHFTFLPLTCDHITPSIPCALRLPGLHTEHPIPLPKSPPFFFFLVFCPHFGVQFFAIVLSVSCAQLLSNTTMEPLPETFNAAFAPWHFTAGKNHLPHLSTSGHD